MKFSIEEILKGTKSEIKSNTEPDGGKSNCSSWDSHILEAAGIKNHMNFINETATQKH